MSWECYKKNFPWNDGSGSPVDVGRNRNVRLVNNSDKDSLNKTMSQDFHAFVELQEHFPVLYSVLYVRWALRACPARVEGGVGTGGRGESCGCEGHGLPGLAGRVGVGQWGQLS